MAKIYQLKKPIEWYQPSNSAAHWSDKEMRAMYSEMRKVAVKRINRLKNSQYYESEYIKDGFDPLPKSATGAQIRKSLYEVALFLNTKMTTITGQEDQLKKFVETMIDRNYDWINMDNALDFSKFMKRVKKHYKNRKEYYPEGTVEFFEEIVTRKASPSDLKKAFDLYLENQKKSSEEAKMEEAKKKDDAEESAPVSSKTSAQKRPLDQAHKRERIRRPERTRRTRRRR